MDYRRTYIKDLLGSKAGQSVEAFGWVKTKRDSKGVSFVQLSDGSSFNDLQVVVDSGTISDDLMKLVTTGACVKFSGELVESPGQNQSVELRASELEVFGAAEPNSYPMQKKGATLLK